MSLLTASDASFLRIIAALGVSNPFLPERKALEKKALGERYVDEQLVWSLHGDPTRPDPNVTAIHTRLRVVVERARARLADGRTARPDEVSLYQEAVLFLLFHDYGPRLQELARAAPLRQRDGLPAPWYRQFTADHARLLPSTWPGATRFAADKLFAFFFQVHRAFVHIFENIVGTSLRAAELRGRIWQSCFTHDMRRYFDTLHTRMADFSTLITGSSGSGKELVARAIGMSQFIPFDTNKLSFQRNPAHAFHGLNIAAFSPTLVESELFGHSKGAFTGAVADRAGWLERVGTLGCIFLDEVGEIELDLQVKLLRVLQTRTFQRLGETEPRRFDGKIIAATNRSLPDEMESGRFREDLYYRLCSDMIETPSLRELLHGQPAERRLMVRFIAARVLGGLDADPAEADAIADEATRFIEEKIDPDYPWPGNFRELEQCVRNVLIRREYRPAEAAPSAARAPALEPSLRGALRNDAMTADEMLDCYCHVAHEETGSWSEAARRLNVDRRTVKTRAEAWRARQQA